jgi:hypothetical protein
VNQPEDLNQPEELNEQGESFAEFEQQLTQALRRVDAPKGFAERTMTRAQVADEAPGKVLMMPSRIRLWTSGAIAAALVAGVFVADQMHVRHQREVAQQQFEAGMRITDRALDHARERLEHAGVRFGD